jgi:signal transduction histidine kinase
LRSSRVAEGLASVLDELREISRGIHPAMLAEGALAPALNTLVHRLPMPVALNVRADGRGSGLIGLKDRVEALGGTISLHSPLGAGTSVDVELPFDDKPGGYSS